MSHIFRVFLTLSFVVSIMAQKKSADSTYPIVIEVWNPIRFSTSLESWVIIKASGFTFSERTQVHMYKYARYILLR